MAYPGLFSLSGSGIVLMWLHTCSKDLCWQAGPMKALFDLDTVDVLLSLSTGSGVP